MAVVTALETYVPFDMVPARMAGSFRFVRHAPGVLFWVLGKQGSNPIGRRLLAQPYRCHALTAAVTLKAEKRRARFDRVRASGSRTEEDFYKGFARCRAMAVSRSPPSNSRRKEAKLNTRSKGGPVRSKRGMGVGYCSLIWAFVFSDRSG